jgi:hypothetical protein
MVKKLFLILFMACCSSAAQADPVILHYGVYGGGFQVLDAIIATDINTKTYKIGMNAKPFGVLGHLLPWAGDHNTTGIVENGKLIPVEHNKLSNWRDDKDHVIMSYKDGVLVKMHKTGKVDGKQVDQDMPLDPEWHKDTTDTLSAVAQMLEDATTKNTCNFYQEVYDGRRRFALKFTDEGDVDLPKSDLNVYAGTARKCQIEMVPLKGFDKKTKGYYRIQEDSRAKGELPQAYLARAWKGGPVVAVRIDLRTKLGAVIVHLNKIQH